MFQKIKSLLITRFLLISLLIVGQTFAKNMPVVLLHGIMSDEYAMEPIEQFINQYSPDTYVKNITIGFGALTSLWNMFDQTEWLKIVLEDDHMLKDGFIMIAHSQGGLIGRHYLERYNSPKVHTYISLGSPQQGIFGTPSKIDDRFTFLNLAELYTFKLLYKPYFQRFVSFAGYWHDTLHYDMYMEKCSFLPYLNNEKDHSLAEQFKTNICNLENMVLVNSDQEDIIEPYQSCHFGFYKNGTCADLETMEETGIYQQDRLGLKTLADSGRLHLRMAHCTHTGYQEDEPNFIENILQFLSMSSTDTLN